MANKTPYSISYPIQRGNNGYFQSTYDSIESAKNSIVNLLLTKPGTRPGRPEYGASFWKQVLFEPNVEYIEDIISDSLENDIATFFPELIIDSIQVNRSSEDIDIYIVRIEVNFRLTANSEPTTATVIASI